MSPKVTHTMMIVEDEALVAADIEHYLTKQGYLVVDVVSSAEVAIRRAVELRPDIVLMDIKLKGEMDGISAAIYLKEELHIPVIYLTAHADSETLARAKISQPYGYILKPFKELELKTAVELGLYRAMQEREDYLSSKGEEIPRERGEIFQAVKEESSKKELSASALEAYDFLVNVEPFSQLREETVRKLAQACSFVNYKSGDLLVLEGDSNVSGFALISGRLAIVKSSLSGKDLIVELIPPGDTFGLLAAVDKAAYSATVRAQLDSRVLWIPKALVMKLLDQYPEVSKKFIQDIFDRLRKSQNISRALAHDRVEVRIASALAALVPRFTRSNKASDLTIRMTRQELAELTGSTSETTIRTTKAMEREGILDLSQISYVKILDLPALQAIAEPP